MATDYEYLFKIVLMGDSGVGKSSLALRYIDDAYTDGHFATIGVDFSNKFLDLGPDGIVKLQIWDTAGQERFRAIVHHVSRGLDGLVVVYDVTDMASFEHVRQWFKDVESYSEENKPSARLLVGNKTDLTSKRVVPFDTAQALADELGLVYVETSAKNTTNVTKAFDSMARAIVKHRKSNPTSMDDPKGRLNNLVSLGRKVPKQGHRGCSC